jgi:hypothetical protein
MCCLNQSCVLLRGSDLHIVLYLSNSSMWFDAFHCSQAEVFFVRYMVTFIISVAEYNTV